MTSPLEIFTAAYFCMGSHFRFVERDTWIILATGDKVFNRAFYRFRKKVLGEKADMVYYNEGKAVKLISAFQSCIGGSDADYWD